ncbi:hypothetical protein PV326_006242, partial [Microctonus aethiopoides]
MEFMLKKKYITSLSSNDSDHDILRANSRSQHIPIPAPIIPTPVPQNPTPIPRPLSTSPPNIIRHNTPSLSPKDHIQSIPYFEGTPMCYDASELIIHCKNASSYIPQYKEYEILALLTGRLKGEALRRAYKGLHARKSYYLTVPKSARQTLNDDITNGFVHGSLKKYLRLFTTKKFSDFTAAYADARRAEGELAEYPQLDDTDMIRQD